MSLKQLPEGIKPRQLFLLDSLGALLTAFLLGVILVKFEGVFGMPRQVLRPLALIACVFSIYSFVCYLRIPDNWRRYLRIIAVANLLYCCLSIGLVIYCYPKLSVWGLSYFLLECAIVISLAMIELKKAQ